MFQPTRTALVLSILAAPAALAADIEAGHAKVAQVCGACHGVNGVSVNEGIPNLAAQRAGYIESQLKALKDGTRKNPIMNAMAAQLTPDEISNVAAYFASLPGAPTAAKSELLPNVAKSGVTFPEGYNASFTKYLTMNFPATKQVRYFYANDKAVKAAKAGESLPDGSYILGEVYTAKLDSDGKPVLRVDGFYEPEKLVAYTAMARDTGWGKDIPEMLRNENWNYAVFTTAKQPRAGVNQAECLGCHKPMDKASYTFTLKDIAAVR